MSGLVRRSSPAAAAVLALWLSGCASAPPARSEATPPYASAAVVNRSYEFDVAMRPGPLELVAWAEVDGPSGATTTLQLFRRGETLAARFRPAQEGLHRWRVVAPGGEQPRVLARGSMSVEDHGHAGGVRARGGVLVDDAGRVFRPLGENRFDVYDPASSDGLSIEEYVRRMAADGMNTVRVFVLTACGGDPEQVAPGCLEPRLGVFDEEAAARYDELFAAAERHDVKVVLSIFALGFTIGDERMGWEANPYAAARGGPARAPRDLFTLPAARDAARRRLRYVLARWAASPALLAVDLLNEPESDGPIPESAWIPWAQDLAGTWRALDPYGHPVTLGSVGLQRDVERDERPWWASEGCDLVQWHRYGTSVHDVHALAKALVGTVRDTARYGKPVLLGEFGWGHEPAPLHDHTHVGLWATTFAGAGVLAQSAPPSTRESDAPMTPARAAHFRTLSAILRRAEAGGPLVPAPDPDVSITGARALALAGELAVAVWVHGPPGDYGPPVRDLSISLSGLLAPGRWRATWLDDVTGRELGGADVQVQDGAGRVTVAAPPFTRHVALLLERQVRPSAAFDQRATPARNTRRKDTSSRSSGPTRRTRWARTRARTSSA